MQINLETNIVFDHIEQSDKRYIVEQGGTRSGKTYNILMWIIFSYCARNRGKVISLVRKQYPSLRATAMKDFFEILERHNLYDKSKHHMTTSEYKLFGNTIEFVSLDQPQKIRGRKRDLLFINEGNELSWEDYFQLNIRTNERIIIDYNPSEEFHWIYDRVVTREDCDFHVTTYKDNPFLDKNLVEEIERLKETDEVYWRVYGEGQRAQSRAVIFRHETIEEIPENAVFLAYGLDFGYTNDPTALVEVWEWEERNALIFQERIYETGLTNQMISEQMKFLGVTREQPVYADSAEPKSIDELRRMGFNVRPVSKGRDSVNVGIDLLRRHKLYWTTQSSNGIKEMRNYKWKEDKDGKLLNTPVDAFNHLIDALRYGVYMTKSNPTYGQYVLR